MTGPLCRLMWARHEAGMSQGQAGALIGKTGSHYSKIERGQLGMDAREALTLCNHFGLTLAELLETRQ